MTDMDRVWAEFQEPSGVRAQHAEGVFGQPVTVPLQPVDLQLDTTVWLPYPA